MITISLDELRARLDDYLDEAARGDVVVTRDGAPWIVLSRAEPGATGQDEEEVGTPEFWEMIRRRRQESAIPWEHARAELGDDPDAG